MIKDAKINQLLTIIPKDAIIVSSWLVDQGYPYELQQRYRKSGWLKSIGKGAMVRPGTTLKLEAAIAAIQQTGTPIHIGGRTALTLAGKAHYILLNQQQTDLFTPVNLKLPEWISSNKWNSIPKLYRNSMIPETLGLTEYYFGEIKVRISDPSRAIMECLSLAPGKFSLQESYEIMEGLNMLRPDNVQRLLDNCNSVKVNRLFLWFAEKAGHPWLKYINLNSINLGTGKRSVVKQGVMTPKYDLLLPESLAK